MGKVSASICVIYIYIYSSIVFFLRMVPPPVEDDDVHVDEDEDKHSNHDARLIQHVSFFIMSTILDRRRWTWLRGRWWRGCATGRFGSSNPEYSNKAQCINIDGWGWNFGFTFRKFLEVIWRYQLFRMLIPTHSWFTQFVLTKIITV